MTQAFTVSVQANLPLNWSEATALEVKFFASPGNSSECDPDPTLAGFGLQCQGQFSQSEVSQFVVRNGTPGMMSTAGPNLEL